MLEGFGLCRCWPQEPGVYNEDDYLIDPELGLAVLSSGRGAIGMQGKPAAALAQWSVAGEVEHAADSAAPPPVLEAGFTRAHQAVHRLSRDWPGALLRPWTALAAVLIRGTTATLFSAGGIRVLRARRDQVEVMLGPPLDADRMTQLMATTSGIGLADAAPPDQRTVDVEPDDTLLLAPPSLLEHFSEAQIHGVLTTNATLPSAVMDSFDALHRASPTGDTSVCVVRIGGQSARSSGSSRPAISWLFDPGRPLAPPPRRYDGGPDKAWFDEVFSLVFGEHSPPKPKSEPPKM